jgi:hypothetical protein
VLRWVSYMYLRRIGAAMVAYFALHRWSSQSPEYDKCVVHFTWLIWLVQKYRGTADTLLIYPDMLWGIGGTIL